MCARALSHVQPLQPHGRLPARLLYPWDFPDKNTGAGCHFLLQRIFPSQGLNPCLLHLLHWQGQAHSSSPVPPGKPMQYVVVVQLLSYANSLRPPGLQLARFPCPSPSPRVCSNSCPLSRWCHPTISSSVVSFSSCPQSFLASGSFPMSQLFTSVAKVLEFQHQSFQWIFRVDFL